MSKINISSTLIRGEPLSVDSDREVQISTVCYEHQKGMPARFCAGLLPPIDLAIILKSAVIKSTIRLVDPTTIANHCNGWAIERSEFRDTVSQFLNDSGVDFFFDASEPITSDSMMVLHDIGIELERSNDAEVMDIIQRIKESGRRHGGDLGADNALLYAAAHPFLWLDMHHPAIWKRVYATNHQFVNLMSKSEERFSVVRQFLRKVRPNLLTGIDPINVYTTICNTPCYIPLEGEPTFADLNAHGYDWCYGRYVDIKKKSRNHERVYSDFRTLMTFLGLNTT
jgi:hypothetical protein